MIPIRATTVVRLRAVAVLALAAAAWAPGLPAQIAEQPAAPWLSRAEAMLDGDPDGALALADRMVEAAGAESPRAHYQALAARAALQRRRGRYGEAAMDFERCSELAEALPDVAMQADARAELGVMLSLSGLYPEAIQALQQARSLYDSLGNAARVSAMLNNLGNVHGVAGDHDTSRAYYRLALELKREHGIERGMSALLNNLADLERELGDVERARGLLLESVQRHEAEGDRHGISLTRGNLGLVLAQLGDFRGALAELDQAEQLAAGGEVRLLAAVHAARAEAFLRVARESPVEPALREQRMQRALDAIARARAVVESMDDPRRKARIARLGSDIEAEAGNFPAALALLREAGEHDAEVQRRANSSRLAVLALRFHDAQQRNEIATLRETASRRELALQRQRWLLALAAGGALSLAALAVLLARRAGERRRHAAMLTERNVALGDALLDAERLRAESERLAAANRRLLALVGQDLRGPLVGIRNLAERLLVGRRIDGSEQRQVAAIAQASGELLRVVEQIADAPVGTGGGRGDGERRCEAVAVLRGVVQDIDARFLGRERRLRVTGTAAPPVPIERDRLERLLHQLIDAVLLRNPGDAPIAIDARPHDGGLFIRIDDPAGLIVQSLGQAAGGVGIAVTRGLLRELGGELEAEPGNGLPQLRLRLPLETQALA
jgi:tetratricopeptide (TPR) repeat protein